MTKVDRALEQAVLSLLQETQRGGSITPNDAAQAVAEDWRALAERARDAARRLAARGLVEFFQSGRRVDPSSAKGPVQLRRAREDAQRGTST